MNPLSQNNLYKSILGRDTSFLQDDVDRSFDAIERNVSKARVLIIGAAGSIGSSFVHEICRFSPLGLHLVDISENNLVEVVRDLRSSGIKLPADFKTYALDFGETEMKSLLRKQDYEYVLNFSALKHVRSERDPYTLMRLLQVNVLANNDLVEELKNMKSLKRVFSVSSDKSVRPANLMGASKAFMERVFLAHAGSVEFSSARFANVAFSDGSLLHGFGNRIMKQQPLTAPNDVKRYFITHQEAGQLCVLGCFAGNNEEVFFPKFDPDRDMLTFAEIAKVYLRQHDLEPIECESEEAALEFMKNRPSGSRQWACYFSSSDTSGEKPYEEFNDPEEDVDLERYLSVGVVTRPVSKERELIDSSVQKIRNLRDSGEWSMEDLLHIVQLAVPELAHVKANKNLDQKM